MIEPITDPVVEPHIDQVVEPPADPATPTPPVKTFTQEEVDAMLAARLERDRKKQEEAAKLAGMNAQEKADHELAQLKQQISDLERKNTLSSMSREASKMLTESGIVADDEVLDFVVKETAEDTQNAVKSFVSLVNKKAEEITKEKLSGTSPKVYTNPGQTMTKVQIMAIKDATRRQQAMLENIHLFQ